MTRSAANHERRARQRAKRAARQQAHVDKYAGKRPGLDLGALAAHFNERRS